MTRRKSGHRSWKSRALSSNDPPRHRAQSVSATSAENDYLLDLPDNGEPIHKPSVVWQIGEPQRSAMSSGREGFDQTILKATGW